MEQEDHRLMVLDAPVDENDLSLRVHLAIEDQWYLNLMSDALSPFPRVLL